jgi:hypothetical protein
VLPRRGLYFFKCRPTVSGKIGKKVTNILMFVVNIVPCVAENVAWYHINKP